MDAVVRYAGVNKLPLVYLKESQVPIGWEHYWLAAAKGKEYS